tara:strand:+ start:254 stop:751 length:498 start_codon:yes stop_codon:yes gene_type:complete
MIFDAYEIDNRIKPNIYTVHTEGGYHMFYYRCSEHKDLHPLYREKIWPYVEMPHKENKILWPGVSRNDPYPRLHLIPKVKSKNESGNFKEIFIYMHQLIGSLHKKKNPNDVVNHINGNPVDYRLQNLEYVSLVKNAKGVKRKRMDYDEIYDSYLGRGFKSVYEFK